LKLFLRTFLLLGLATCFLGNLRAQENPAPAQGAPSPPQTNAAPAPPTSYQITGSVHSGKTPLPGVTLTASNTLTGKKYTAATVSDGTFVLPGLPRGRYVLRAEFMGFATQTQEVVLNPESPSGKADLELILASRQQEQTTERAAATAAAGAGRGFQSLSIDATEAAPTAGEAGLAAGAGQNPSANDLAGLPLNGAGADAPTESVSISGAQGRTQDFGQGSEGDLQDRIQEFRDRAQQNGLGGFGGGGGGGGFGGGPGGGGPIAFGRMGRGFNTNQPHGNLYFYDDTSALDARPFSINGEPLPRVDYNQLHFGGYVGGPLNIPKIYNGGNKTFFFGGWSGTRGSSPSDVLSTVPTMAERGGNFSALTTPIFNPQTGQQFDYGAQLNVIDPTLITPQAQALLNYIPLPNLPGTTQNYHEVTSSESNSDTVSLRLIHNFGPVPAQGNRTPGGGRGGGGGGGGRRRSQNNLNLGLSWTKTTSAIVGAFPSLDGGTGTQGLNATAAWVYGKGHTNNNLRFTYNHNHVSTTNLYSFVTDVAGLAQIGGVSTNPFDWGIPGINFTSFSGLNDTSPRRELDQTYTASDTVIWNHGKHNWRFGGDYRRILQSFRAARNAAGTFTFTGFATAQYIDGIQQAGTGSDLADFLLGLPQQSTVQFGTDTYNFRANSYDFFAQDDWRIRANLTLLLGVRYEYQGPFTEADNHIANLDVNPSFTAAVPVEPGQTGPYNGVFPASLIKPDRDNFAPRLGLAWKPLKLTVVRAGYGVNYNLAQYGAVVQNFAFQPPFAETSTNVATPSSFLNLANAFPTLAPDTVTNNFGINPNYKLAYVQLWNVDIQRDLGGGFLLNIDYNGSKGTRLDTERAILIPPSSQQPMQQPFTYESSEGNSVFHAGSVRIRKRLAKGISLNATYIYSKSIDDASSIGGGGVVVAQNPFDISADRGLSSFDQRHKFTGNWIYDLPFGENRRFLQKGPVSYILAGWQWSGGFTVASGLPNTIRVLGGTLDIDRGVSGSLRANVVPGETIGIGDPTTKEWFNTAAFCQPQTTAGNTSATCVNPADSTFGDAGRNILIGPGQVSLNMSLNKTITIKEYRSLDLRITANNVFNMVYFTSLGTTVNSTTFGEVTGAGAMRRVTVQARFRF
jgi:trimeric autotransporter adhesin